MSDLKKILLVAVILLVATIHPWLLTTYKYVVPAWFGSVLWLITVLLSLSILLTTNLRVSFFSFVNSSYIELRKVVWPTKQEALQTTMLVLAVLVVAGMVLWVLDSVLLNVIGIITGNKG